MEGTHVETAALPIEYCSKVEDEERSARWAGLAGEIRALLSDQLNVAAGVSTLGMDSNSLITVRGTLGVCAAQPGGAHLLRGERAETSTVQDQRG